MINFRIILSMLPIIWS